MFIEELSIDGFKSYSTRTYVGPFDHQFNAITGLNGSGKSNILDSICFVLGISNLSQVRVGNLSELVYKQGQAGVTKASVTIIFNNEDKASSPVGYEMHDKITITRQIVIGGRNRYLLNGHNVQANQIQNLFHSVQLNVNNPHFLIMQGRITKVINMKPPETLGMIEEAAGTRMYENKKAVALRTLEKKQNKVDEINRLLSEEITPTLQKLQKERENYMRWMSNNNEMETLSRFCIAYEYVQAKSKLDDRNSQLQELEDGNKTLMEEVKAIGQKEKEMEAQMKELTSLRDKQRSKELRKAEEDHTKLTKDLVAAESKLENTKKALEADRKGRTENQKQTDEMRKSAETKEKACADEDKKTQAIVEETEAAEKDVEKMQRTMQALSAGVSQAQAEGEECNKSLREQLLAAQTRLSEIDGDERRKMLSIGHLKEQIMSAEGVQSKSVKDSKVLIKEKGLIESLVKDLRGKVEGLGFDPARYQTLENDARREEATYQQLADQVNSRRAVLSNVDFRYEDPEPKFNRNRVKGVVAKLFTIKPEHADYTVAVQVCAGGRLWHVVVDNEQTGKALLQKGQLRRRVTIVPLNKISTPEVPDNVFRAAQKVAASVGGQVLPALQVIGSQREVENAMKFVFGGFLVCDTPETAKKVTFHPDVRVRSVTKGGDLYDPSGLLTGGSAPKGGNILQQLQELADLEEKTQKMRDTMMKNAAERERMRASAAKYSELARTLQCKEHELELCNERIKGSEHHAATEELQSMKEKAQQFESELEALPEERKKLQKEVKQLEKDIKSFDSSREDRLAKLGKDIEKKKADLKKKAEVLRVQREKQDKLLVDFEAAKSELDSWLSVQEASGGTLGSAEAEVQRLENAHLRQKALTDEATAKLDMLRVELVQTDEMLTKLSKDIKEGQQAKEEKEIELKKIGHRIAQFHKDFKEVNSAVAHMEKHHPWIPKESSFFGKPGTDFDFEKIEYATSKKRLDTVQSEQKNLSKSINKKAMAMFDRAEIEYKDLLSKRDTVLNDRSKIEKVIKDLDLKKDETLKRTWAVVNKHFGSIFSTLLPGTNAKLEAPEGMAECEGLEIKVSFNGVWKQSLTELSGGQKSLLALSLVLALLLFKPAPMYILDEIDSALDLSHTQNIGHMIKRHFPHSQFVIVSLKEGMFNNANVLFRTRFVDGCSTVTRYSMGAVKDKDDEKVQKGKKRKGEALENQENVQPIA